MNGFAGSGNPLDDFWQARGRIHNGESTPRTPLWAFLDDQIPKVIGVLGKNVGLQSGVNACAEFVRYQLGKTVNLGSWTVSTEEIPNGDDVGYKMLPIAILAEVVNISGKVRGHVFAWEPVGVGAPETIFVGYAKGPQDPEA